MGQPLRTLIMVPNVNPQPDARGMGIGGAERMALQLCIHLDRQRITPLLMVLRDPGESADLLRAAGVPVFVIPKQGRLPLTFWLALRSLIKRERIDAVLSLLQGTNSHNLIVTPTVPGVGCLISYRSQDVAPQFQRTEGPLAARADYLITLNKTSSQLLAQHYRLPAARIVAIPNGADPELLPAVPYSQRRSGRAALGLPEDAFILYSCARIARVKGHDLLARALVSLGPLLQERQILWVNSGAVQDRAMLQEVMQVLGVQSKHFLQLDQQSKPHPLYAAADAVLVPSRSESFGLSMVEAGLVGRPLLASAVGAAPELLADGRGWLAEAGSAESLSQGLRQLLGSSEEQLAARGEQLGEYARAHFSIRASADSYADVIEAAVARRRGSHGRGG